MSNQPHFCFEPREGHCVHAPSSWTLLILYEHLRNRKCIMLTMIQIWLPHGDSEWDCPVFDNIHSQAGFIFLAFLQSSYFSFGNPFNPPNRHMICLLNCGIWVICGQKPYSRILTKVYGLLALGTLANIVACPDISVRKLGTVGLADSYISKWYTKNSEVT